MVANTTMGTTRRSIKFARDAPFHAYRNPIDLDTLIQRSPEIILPIFVRRSLKKGEKYIVKIKLSRLCAIRIARNHFFYLSTIENLTRSTYYLPFGITPGSMNVARVKFVSTKKVITPWRAGTHVPQRKT